MTVLDDFRQKYPQYKDVPDGKLAAAIRTKYYAKMPIEDFYRKAGLTHLVKMDENPQPQNGLGSNVQNYFAGMGKSVSDNVRGLAQTGASMLGNALAPVDVLTKVAGIHNVVGDAARNTNQQLREDQSRANLTDAPLMATKAGLAGNISGQAMQAVAAGTALKGAGVIDSVMPQTYRGAAMAGAAQGAIQPLDASQPEGDRLLNAGTGLAGGVIGQAIPAVVGGAARTIRGLIDPITDSGQSRIIANTINRFGQGGNMTPAASAVQGVQPTLAEATGNAGIGQLQRAVTDTGAADGTLNQFVQRGLDNNAARVAAVRGVAGTAGDLDQAMADRAAQSGALYQKAMGTPNTPVSSPELQSLGSRPSFQAAVDSAKKLAADQGINIGDDPTKSVQGLHFIKLAIDDMMQPNAASALGRNQQAALQGTKQQLLTELEKISPEYAQAKDAFQQASKPINQMQTGQALLDKAGSPVLDPLGNPTLTPARYASNLGKLDQIAQKATGYKGATAEGVFTPDQLSILHAVGGDLNKKAASESLGKSAGSNTVQNLGSQSMLGEISKATGLNIPSDGIIARLVKPIDAAYKLFGAPEEIRGKLAQLMLNPTSPASQKILSRIPAAQRPAFERSLAPYTGFVGQQAGVSVGK